MNQADENVFIMVAKMRFPQEYAISKERAGAIRKDLRLRKEHWKYSKYRWYDYFQEHYSELWREVEMEATATIQKQSRYRLTEEQLDDFMFFILKDGSIEALQNGISELEKLTELRGRIVNSKNEYLKLLNNLLKKEKEKLASL